ncbi:glycine oxidase ThiO, partial [cf. Phormidesmis sp. LEGE 11477]
MQQAEVIVIGGGSIGLAIALELNQQGTKVTVLSKDFTAAAGHAAAGMLAPNAERLPSGPMFELCQRSLELYPTWTSKLENLTGKSSGYWPCGILSPRIGPGPSPADPEVEVEEPKPNHEIAFPISADAIHSYQSGLGQNVVGGYFYPEDAQVDNRALMQTLRAAAQDAGIEIREGVAVEGFVQCQGQVISLRTSVGQQQADHYVLATGAWSRELLPIPVTPTKGQMVGLRVPLGYGQTQPLHRVLYGEKVYIVPRRDGRIILGATVEKVGFAPHNTPAGIAQLLNAAIELYPTLANFSIEECWWGFRPDTPDQLPILGASPCENMTLATGHYRNGILLAPITAKLIAAHIKGSTDPLLNSFSYKRFRAASNSALAHRYSGRPAFDPTS